MTEWQRNLNLKDVWETGDIHLIAKTASKRLKEIMPFGIDDLDAEREELAYDFGAVAADAEADANDFDEVMSRLYDWADTKLDDKDWTGKKVCWVATFF